MAFSCVGCNRTFPDKDDKGTGELGDPGICPDCYEEEEEDEDDEERRTASGHPWIANGR